jgi:hypothetical protein
MNGRKRLAYGTGKIGAVLAELCEQLRAGTPKDQLSCTIAPGSTMGLDSSAPTVSAGWLWQMRSVSAFEVRDRSPMEVADNGLGHFLRLLLPCCRQSGSYQKSVRIEVRVRLVTMKTLKSF